MPETEKFTSEEALADFTQPTRHWFRNTFSAATPVQAEAWQAIARGGHSLIIAPTGSGKTLAAFLNAIDRLFKEREAAPTAATDSKHDKTLTRILYISPVKALAADVQRNLQIPLEGVCAERRRLGASEISLRVGMRSGDTSTADRARLMRHPPDILITTPESLFLMLTSKARSTLEGVTTVILDEIHAIAGSKRGSQLALSLERLDRLLPQPAQRIGLSATVQPVDRMAQFLGGTQPTQVVNPASPHTLQMQIVVPVEDMTDIPGRPDQTDSTAAAGSIWPHVESAILAQVLSHHSTLVFTNSRGLAEKLTARLNERWAQQGGNLPSENAEAMHYGSFSGGTEKRADDVPVQIARSHHGSVSKEQRLEIESALKAGELRCVVATSSLELGIDMGRVDLVIQVGAPLSVASALQRVGRAGHQVGGTSHGIVYPRTRRDLVDAIVTVRSMQNNELEAIAPPRNPLDVLAQQTIAAVAMDTWQVDDWFATVRRADPFRTLSRAVFDAVLDMLAGRYPSDAFAQFRPRLVWHRDSGLLSARPSAQHLAVTSGGTIPDRGMFSVVLPEGEEQSGARRVGELDEEMVYESRVNDIITLGATSWRIQQITHDQVVVVPAPGRSARLPFWHGEGLGRAASLGAAVGRFLRQLEFDTTAEAGDPRAPLYASGLNESAVNNLLALVAAQREATGVLPTDQTLLVERCRDETGDWRIILHSPYGQRVHAPWALAIAERIRQRMGLDPSVVASDDGIIARFPETESSVPGAELFIFEPDTLQRVVTDSVAHSALFAARFRECAARALLLPRRNPGKRSPLWQQRLRAGQLLEVAREFPDFPILIETARECLQDVYDLPALHQLMANIQRGAIQFAQVTTESPSPFAAPLLFGYVAEFMYASDAPLAERRASLLALDSNLLGELLGQVEMQDLLAPEVIAQVSDELQRLAPDYQATHAEGMVDILRELGPLSLAEAQARFAREGEPVSSALAQLEKEQRIIRVQLAGEWRWAAIEDAARLRDALGTRLPGQIPSAFLQPVAQPLTDLISRFARTHTLFSSQQVADRFGLGVAVVDDALSQLRAQGTLLQGDFAQAGLAWINDAVFKRLRIRSLHNAREATRPVPHSAWVTLLLERQGLLHEQTGLVSIDSDRPAQGLFEGVNGVVRVIEQLAGLPLPASLWESQILSARVHDYQPAMLDELLSSGEVVWCGHKPLGAHDGLISLHLTEYAAETLPPVDDEAFTPLQQAIIDGMAPGGAWFARQILAQQAEAPASDVYRALWELVWRGCLTTDTWSAVRAFTDVAASARSRPARPSHRRRGRPYAAGFSPRQTTDTGGPGANTITGRWSLIVRDTLPPTRQALALVENMQDRYGVITRSAAVTEQIPGGFPALQPLLRSLEDAGRLLRGRFVEGLGGAQFADNATIERLRVIADRPAASPTAVALSAVDPANPFGTALPWPRHTHLTRLARRNGALVVVSGGKLLLYLAQGGKELLTFDRLQFKVALAALVQALRREKHLNFTLETLDGEPAGRSPLAADLREAGFSRLPKGFAWYG